MRAPSLGQVLVTLGGGLALWASTCFFAPRPRENLSQLGERLELVPGARWEFDLGELDETEGVPTLYLETDAKESARVEVRVEREGIEPRAQALVLFEKGRVGDASGGIVALELTAYDGPSAHGRAYVWIEDQDASDADDRLVAWGLRRSGGMFGLLAAALLVGLGLLLIWRGPKPAGAGAVR